VIANVSGTRICSPKPLAADSPRRRVARLAPRRPAITPKNTDRPATTLAVSAACFKTDQATQSNPSEFYQNAQPRTKCRGVTGSMYNDWYPGSRRDSRDANHCTSLPSRPCTSCPAVHFGRIPTDCFVSLDLLRRIRLKPPGPHKTEWLRKARSNGQSCPPYFRTCCSFGKLRQCHIVGFLDFLGSRNP